MSSGSLAGWQEQNRAFLALALDDLWARMEGEDDAAGPRAEVAALLEAMDERPPLLRLADAFRLDGFEQDLLLWCLGAELDPRFRIDAVPVTVGLALERLAGANWAALDLAAPLRAWGLVAVERAAALADAPIRLTGDVVRFLMGFDPRLEPDAAFVATPASPTPVVASRQALAAEIAQAVATTLDVSGQMPAVELHGAEEEDRVAVAQLCAEALGGSLASADLRDLPAPGAELDALLLTWSRRARLTSTVLCVTGADERDDDPSLRHRVDRALTRVPGLLVLCARRATTAEHARPLIRRRVEPLASDERLEVWTACVEATRARLRSRRTRGLPAELAALASDFRVGARTVQRVCLEAEATLGRGSGSVDPAVLGALLREGCARAVRARLDPLLDRVVLDDVHEVALPEHEARQLTELELSIRLAHEVGTHWGLGRGRTNGATALFAGPSGTGKTHAALVLAKRLGLDLYRANLAGILSKYIGETEKNLDRIFDAAAAGGVVLLFDEADALFGKRSEVRDSHDRYANISTAYLLARIESAPTPTILTTNLKDAIDPAFVRRLHFVIDFPFPSEGQREQIWRTVYPQQTPTEELSPERLSLVAATGGTIGNIARRGAFLAAGEPSAVEMRHLLESSRLELRKLGRDLTPDELEAWEDEPEAWE